MRRHGQAGQGGKVPREAQRPTERDAVSASRAELDRRAREQRERRSRAVSAAAAVGGMASLALVLLGSPAAPTGQPSTGVGAAASNDVAMTAIPDPAVRERTSVSRG
jgi:hypothetical protein